MPGDALAYTLDSSTVNADLHTGTEDPMHNDAEPPVNRNTVALTIAAGLQLRGCTALPTCSRRHTNTALSFTHAIYRVAHDVRAMRHQLRAIGSSGEAQLLYDAVETALIDDASSEAPALEVLLAQNGRWIASGDHWYVTTVHAETHTDPDNDSVRKRYHATLDRLQDHEHLTSAIEYIVGQLAHELRLLYTTASEFK